VSLSDRDRKILLIIVPFVILAAYWFVLLAPKREAASAAKEQQVAQEQRRDTARELVRQATAAQTDFGGDYRELVRLGKAIPSQVDMPSLLVQLDEAAAGTGIKFTKITTGDRVAVVAPAPAPADPNAAPGSTPAAAGGEPAQSAPGTAAEKANGAVATSNQATTAAEQSGVDATTSTASGSGLPVGGGAPGATDAAAAPAPAGLETVPLELEFIGDFFNLADFFHDVKRFVNVVNTDVIVNGRLVTVEGVSFTSDPTLFPRIRAQLQATIYLSPKTQGATAGATPQGPATTTTPASTGTPPADSGSTPAPAPTAVATP
jgi:Tfp pilus assembly protein PilO